MKVMQINCVHNTGSTGKIMYAIHTAMQKRGIESVICYGRGVKADEKNVYKTSSELLAKLNNLKSRFTGMPYSGSFFGTLKLIRIIKKEKPDVVHLHCINGFFVNIYKLVTFLKENNIPTVVTHHAEFLYTGNCSHSYECERWKTGCGKCQAVGKMEKSYIFDFTKHNFWRMKKAFSDFEKICSVSVSPWVQSRAEQSPIFKAFENTTVLNGLDCDVFKIYPDACDIKKKLGISDEKKVILHVTASFKDTLKGGKYILELAEKLDDNTVIVVVGNREEIENLPDNIIAVGRVENQQELARYYSMADLTVITSKRETFSMPVAESMCCGTPIVGFKAGGPESIAISAYSEFADFGDVEALHKIVCSWLDKGINKNEIQAVAQKAYSQENMSEQYINIYYNLLEKKD